jgi:hypothetical protein
MTHDIKFSREGWAVTTRLGRLVIDTVIVDTFTEALAAWARLEGC